MQTKGFRTQADADGTQMNAGNMKTLELWAATWAQGFGPPTALSQRVSAFIRASSAFICVLGLNSAGRQK